MRLALRLSALLVGLSGCVQVLGIQDWAATGAGSGSGPTSGSGASASTEATSTASTGLAQCGTDGNDFCLHIPPGWMGPVTVTLAGGTACSGVFNQDLAKGEADLVGADSQCDCTCNGPSGGACGSAELLWYNDGGCTAPAQEMYAISQSCSTLGGAASNALGFTVTAPPITAPETCAPNLVRVVPPATFDERHVCGLGAVTDSCGAMSNCTPKPDADKEARLCVWSVGTNPCPEGAVGFPVPLSRKPHTDDRDCSVCNCDLSGEACSAIVSVYRGNVCTAGGPQTSSGACVPLTTAGITNAKAAITHTPGSCSAHAPSTPTGSVMPQDPITVCCTLPLGG